MNPRIAPFLLLVFIVYYLISYYDLYSQCATERSATVKPHACSVVTLYDNPDPETRVDLTIPFWTHSIEHERKTCVEWHKKQAKYCTPNPFTVLFVNLFGAVADWVGEQSLYIQIPVALVVTVMAANWLHDLFMFLVTKVVFNASGWHRQTNQKGKLVQCDWDEEMGVKAIMQEAREREWEERERRTRSKARAIKMIQERKRQEKEEERTFDNEDATGLLIETVSSFTTA